MNEGNIILLNSRIGEMVREYVQHFLLTYTSQHLNILNIWVKYGEEWYVCARNLLNYRSFRLVKPSNETSKSVDDWRKLI